MNSDQAIIRIATRLNSGSTVEMFEDAMTDVRAEPLAVLELLRSALLDENLDEVETRSYLHPNGFAKLVLHDPGPHGTSVRLHVWPTVGIHPEFRDALRSDTAPHGHRWTFSSTIVAGTGLLVEDFVRDEASGDPYNCYVFQPAVGAKLTRAGTQKLRSTKYYVRPHDGDVYWCDPDIIHMISPLDDALTATLVLQGPEVTSWAPVYLQPGLDAGRGRRPLSRHTIIRLIEEVVAEIESTWLPETAEKWLRLAETNSSSRSVDKLDDRAYSDPAVVAAPGRGLIGWECAEA